MPESPIALDSLGNTNFIADGHVHLSRLAAVGRGQVLGLVTLSSSAVAIGVATDALSSAERPADKRSALTEEELELPLKFLLALTQALPNPSALVSHGGTVSD